MSGDEELPGTLHRVVTGPWREPPGEDMSRLLALSDGIFAFAMTLLVVNLTGLIGSLCSGSLCSSNSALVEALGGTWQPFVGYVTVFLIAALYWTSHHRMFRYIERYDGVLIWLNILFLLTIAFLPFVLEIYNQYPNFSATLMLASATMAASGLLLGALWFHASGRAGLVDPRLDRRVITYYRRRGFILPTIFVIAIPLALVIPEYAAYLWIASFPASTFLRRYGSA